MDTKLVLFFVLVVIFALQDVEADFWFNHPSPKQEDVEGLKLKCVPGRTIIKVEEETQPLNEPSESSSAELDRRRSHMNFQTEDKSCQICVCSTEGKDEYCSKRPAMNVNECMRMSSLKEGLNEPFDHERSLYSRVRRDYLWHNDEIPYNANAKCPRGHSFYTNYKNTTNMNIDMASKAKNLLDFTDSGSDEAVFSNACFYCVCSPDGNDANCLQRSPWFCTYFRNIRNEQAMNSSYYYTLQQDRPKYFRSLSWRLRRTMDAGMFDLVDSGGDSLCCGHPDGHRRHIHNSVQNKIRQLKKKINKENLMSKSPAGDYVDFIVNND